jgi:hypothetical protein
VGFSRSVFASISQVGVTRTFNSVSSISLRERELIRAHFGLVFASVSQVGVTRAFNSVSSLSLRERARVRGF